MGVRQRLTMRCYPERNTNAAADAWGNPDTPTWVAQPAIPCYVWLQKYNYRFQNADTKRREINRTAYNMLLPKSADLLETDRVQKITDRLGVQIYGAMQIQNVSSQAGHKIAEIIEYE